MNYEEFINSSNMHKLPNRSLMEYDATTLDFCAYHQKKLESFYWKKDDFIIYYNDLNKKLSELFKEHFTIYRKIEF